MDSDIKKQEMITCDVLISGGGPVGLMLALGLAQQGQKVVLAERAESPLKEKGCAHQKATETSFDGRVLALSHGSMVVLEQLGVWIDLVDYVTEIHHVHVSQKGYLGLTKLHAEEVGVPALGYSIQSSDLGRVLWQHVEAADTIQILCPASLTGFELHEHQVCAQVASETTEYDVQSKLIVGADGTDSKVRTLLNLPIEEKSYAAFGVIAQIETEQHPKNWSFERFTDDGPVALLPMQGHLHKAVLVCPESDIEHIKGLDDEGFIELFSSKMGERLGRFTKVSPRVIYPLKETYAPQMTKGRALLMGNASHTQHPVAAQGLNLGIRDIDVFLDMSRAYRLTVGHKANNTNKANKADSIEDIGSLLFLVDYARARKSDHEKVMGLTDTLIQVFQHRSPIVGHLRGIGLMAMQAMPSVKRRFSRFAMGGHNA